MPTLIDIFCGVGIGALGFKRAGFEIAAAVDIDKKACDLYRKNLGIEPITGDLRRLSAKQILSKAGLKKGETFAVSGCPPCQAFSTLRQTRLRKRQRDGRKSLLRVFAERVVQIYPRVVILENVRGLAMKRNKRFLNEFVSRLEAFGYDCKFDVLDAADFGIPQRRKRLILIGVRGARSSLPVPTHSRDGKESGKLRWLTVKDAISHLPPLESGQSDVEDYLHAAGKHKPRVLALIRSIPSDGGSWRDLPKSLWLPCHSRLRGPGAGSAYGRMRWNRPAPTITTRAISPSCGRFLHPTQHRGITLREAAILQSVPSDFRLEGGHQRIAAWVGNAMPTTFAQAIAREAIKYG